jgi:hypothetical protein
VLGNPEELKALPEPRAAEVLVRNNTCVFGICGKGAQRNAGHR